MKTALVARRPLFPWIVTDEQWADAVDADGKPYLPPFVEGELRRMLTPEGFRRLGVEHESGRTR